MSALDEFRNVSKWPVENADVIHPGRQASEIDLPDIRISRQQPYDFFTHDIEYGACPGTDLAPFNIDRLLRRIGK